jgi:hypothetical protein
MVDTVLMNFESRNCGSAHIHAIKQSITILACVAEELNQGKKVSEPLVEKTLRKYRIQRQKK